jgi:antitoxin-like ribbon-helix-helix protein
MSKPKPSLLNSIKEEPETPPEEAKPQAVKAQASASGRSSTMIGGHFPQQVKSSFRMIQEKHPEKKMRDLIVEAFNLLFERYKVPPSAR